MVIDVARARESNPATETQPRVSNWEKPARPQSPTPDPTRSERSYQNPSWPTVVWTTVRVLARRWPFRLAIFVIAGLVVAGLVLGYRALFLTSTRAGEPPGGPSVAAGGPVSAAAAARTEVATWASENIADTAVLACDTATCAELQAHGYPATALVPLTADSGDVRRADLVVVTAAVRALIGRNLAALTAAQPIAVFASGEAAIALRAVAPAGPKAYERRASVDRRQRAAAGTQLGRTPRLELTPTAGEQLRGGRVDARILTVLPALLADHTLTVESFLVSAAEPRGAPLRVMDIARVDGADVAVDQAGTVDIIRFLNAQWPPFLPAGAEVVDGPDGPVLRISYPAPSPLGLLGNGR
ncbi:MAG TPA: hypothetical protein VHO00_10160 [Actinomycetes bacterium]|nr:hypothetical protein [Actinomycetes bacterium]